MSPSFVDVIVRSEARNLLEMWIALEDSWAALPSATRAWLKIGEPTLVKHPLIGFDANHDLHYGAARDLASEPGRFSRFAGKIVDFHTQASLLKQRGMWRAFDKF